MIVCVNTGRSYTYGQLRKACGKLATSLRKCKFLPGDTIAIILPNIPEFAIIALAANEAGLRTTLISPAYTKYEIKRQLENVEAQAIFTFPAKYVAIKASIEKNSKIRLPIVIVNDGTDASSISGTIKLDDLMREDIEDSKNWNKLRRYSILALFQNIVANILQSANPIFCLGEANEHYQDIIPLILPVHHFFGLIVSLYYYLRIGAKLVCLPQFSIEGFTKLLENHRCTVLHVVPPIVQIMTQNERITSRHVESLRLILSGAAPLGEKSIAKFQSRFTNAVTFRQGYGASELSPIATIGTADVSPTSCGYLIPNTQMRIVSTQDDTPGRNLGLREVGEIYIRGPQVMKGYYKNPKATADSMDGDWYKTGDLGYYTEDGLLYVQGRLKEMIKVKGYQVAPIELEEVIRNYHDVQDVAVIGVAHDNYGEIPKAFVVPKSGVKINENDLKKFVAERVAKYKRLGYIQVIESIPKTISGKILRKELKNIFVDIALRRCFFFQKSTSNSSFLQFFNKLTILMHF
ncbi:Uncharacterized protein DBV15_06242 [Temnothorax longispinosus]|uniref:4-coumarate--CoA ligase 3 n=1 Tax=Temnothorax longispinosus TaxID=300112 RepID=A0A4S2KW06_9HYME|nr:Uncharacterized protein DBV15_06242 [Temnothorax longispinosus]